jgi:hypothetical protein
VELLGGAAAVSVVEGGVVVDEVFGGIEEAEVPVGAEGEVIGEAAEDGVGAGGGDAEGFGVALLFPGDGEEVLAGVGVVDAGVAGGDGFAGGGAGAGGFFGVGAVGG